MALPIGRSARLTHAIVNGRGDAVGDCFPEKFGDLLLI
jgi:hypothetical protein